MVKPLLIREAALRLRHKTCFHSFNCTLHYGTKVGIVGQNGSGKSSLLRWIAGEDSLVEGELFRDSQALLSYVPQLIPCGLGLSGGERFQASFDQAMACYPELLLLDEPNNHLDVSHKKRLLQSLEYFAGTLITVSHDPELLALCDQIWALSSQGIEVFEGSYQDFIAQKQQSTVRIDRALDLLKKQEKQLHAKQVTEQQRAKKAKARGKKSIQNSKWATVKSAAKLGRSSAYSNNALALLKEKSQHLSEQRASLRQEDIRMPSFGINTGKGSGVLLQLGQAEIRRGDRVLVRGVDLRVDKGERILLCGNNGCGKSSLLEAIYHPSAGLCAKEQIVYCCQRLCYLDQHYQQLKGESVYDCLQSKVPHWSQAEIRNFLNRFLFRKNEEVRAPIGSLSGGERARLSMALLAAEPPALLLLDEPSNNLDQEAKAHCIQVLQQFQGGILLVSHDAAFIDALKIDRRYDIDGGVFYEA